MARSLPLRESPTGTGKGSKKAPPSDKEDPIEKKDPKSASKGRRMFLPPLSGNIHAEFIPPTGCGP